jgi:putative peptide zinc metalloprotease protein
MTTSPRTHRRPGRADGGTRTALAESPGHSRNAAWLDAAGSRRMVVCETVDGSLLQMSPTAYWLFERIRDGLTPEEITELISAQFGQQVSSAAIASACDGIKDRIEKEQERIRKVERRRYAFRIRLLREPAVARIAGWLRPLFSRPAAVGYGLLVLTAVAMMIFADPFRSAYRHLGASSGLAVAYGIYLLALCGHELGHATACARFRLRPGDIGFAVYLIFPAVYCDVTRVWLLPRRQRVLVDVGGLLFETAAGAAYVIGAAVFHSWVLALAAIMLAGNLLWVLNPFGRFDVYWALSDALGVTDLRGESARAFRDILRIRRGGGAPEAPRLARPLRLALVAYAVATVGVFGWFGYSILSSVPYLVTHLYASGALAAHAAARGQAKTALEAAVNLALPGLIFAVLYYRIAGVLWPAVRKLGARCARSLRRRADGKIPAV